MELFAINCTTCRARLKVREQSAIGQIVNCPKCGCMLQIAAPAGWQPPQAPVAPAAVSGRATLPAQAIWPTQSTPPAQEISPAAAMAAVLAAAESTGHGRTPESKFVLAGIPVVGAVAGANIASPAGMASPAGVTSPGSGALLDPLAVRVEIATAAAPAALPAKRSVWLPVAKDCLAAWLPWACVPLAGMLSAWVVGYCLQSDVPAESLVAAPPRSAEIAPAAIRLAAPSSPANAEAAFATAPVPVQPAAPATAPSPEPKIEPPLSSVGNQPPSRVALRPITPSPDMETASRLPAGPPPAPPQVSALAIKPQSAPSKVAPSKVAAKPKPAMPSLVNAPRVDLAQALATPIANLNLPSIPLVAFAQLVEGLTGVPLTLDTDACRELAIKLDAPLAVHERDVSLGELLKHVLEPHGLMAEVVQGNLVITASAAHRHQLQSVRYVVSDLNDTPTALAGWIEQLVEPQRWIGHGGAGRVDVDGPQLIVLQTPRVQHEVLLLLDKLRLARGKPAVGRLDPFEVSLESPSRQMAARLDNKVSVNYREGAELETVVRDLAQRAEVRLTVDWQSLAAAGYRPQSLVSLLVDEQPLAASLDELLTPLDLSYRVVGADTLEVASITALRARPELEVYPVRDLLQAIDGAQIPAEAIGRWLAVELPDATWGGASAWRFDRQSSCLLVRHDALTQRAIEAALRSSAEAASADNGIPVRENRSAANPASPQP